MHDKINYIFQYIINDSQRDKTKSVYILKSLKWRHLEIILLLILRYEYRHLTLRRKASWC